jgi:PhnB protein
MRRGATAIEPPPRRHEEQIVSKVKPIPEGYHVVTPHLAVRGAAKALEFYAKAFGAEERFRMPGPGDSVMHAEMQIGDSIVMLADEAPKMGSTSPQSLGGSAVNLLLYVNDVDASFARATQAGCKTQMPQTAMFWGDRYCKIEDPFGHLWSIATHKEDVAPEEMARRMAAMG